MDQRSTIGPFLQKRLDSWKSVAQYLDRSCRTVQRWHSNYGLPIYHLNGKKSSVFAYSREIDDWMINHGRLLVARSAEIPESKLLQMPFVREEPDNYNETLDVSTMDGLKKTRSSNLVDLAYRLWGSLSQNNLSMIAQYFREAIDLDPSNAAAYAGLSLTMICEALWGVLRPPVAYATARTALQQALKIDSKHIEAKYAESWIKMVLIRDWQGARRGFNEALALCPRTRGERIGGALLHIAEGCPKKASALLLEVVQQSVLRSDAITLYCWSEYLAGEYSNVLFEIEQYRIGGRFGPIVDAIEALTKIQFFKEPDAYIHQMELQVLDSPDNDVLRGALGYVYGVTGQVRNAHEHLNILTNPDMRGKRRSNYAIALVLVGMNQIQKALNYLEQSYLDGSLWSLGFLSDPILASVRKDPLFQQLLSKVTYPVPHESNPF